MPKGPGARTLGERVKRGWQPGTAHGCPCVRPLASSRTVSRWSKNRRGQRLGDMGRPRSGWPSSTRAVRCDDSRQNGIDGPSFGRLHLLQARARNASLGWTGRGGVDGVFVTAATGRQQAGQPPLGGRGKGGVRPGPLSPHRRSGRQPPPPPAPRLVTTGHPVRRAGSGCAASRGGDLYQLTESGHRDGRPACPNSASWVTSGVDVGRAVCEAAAACPRGGPAADHGSITPASAWPTRRAVLGELAAGSPNDSTYRIASFVWPSCSHQVQHVVAGQRRNLSAGPNAKRGDGRCPGPNRCASQRDSDPRRTGRPSPAEGPGAGLAGRPNVASEPERWQRPRRSSLGPTRRIAVPDGTTASRVRGRRGTQGPEVDHHQRLDAPAGRSGSATSVTAAGPALASTARSTCSGRSSTEARQGRPRQRGKPAGLTG